MVLGKALGQTAWLWSDREKEVSHERHFRGKKPWGDSYGAEEARKVRGTQQAVLLPNKFFEEGKEFCFKEVDFERVVVSPPADGGRTQMFRAMHSDGWYSLGIIHVDMIVGQ